MNMSLDDIVRANRQSNNRRLLNRGGGRGSFGSNVNSSRNIGFERGGAIKRRTQDLRQNLALKRKFTPGPDSDRIVDAREKIARSSKLKKVDSPQKMKLIIQVPQQTEDAETHMKSRSEKRSLDFTGDGVKITTKQQIRSAESTSDGTILVTANVFDYKKPERSRTADLSYGKLSITAKNNPVKKVKTEMYNSPLLLGGDFPDSPETDGLSGRLGPKNEQDSSRTASGATRITVTNLHPLVTLTDIEELFGVVGQLKSSRLLQKGMAEVVYAKKEDALMAYSRYHNRNLDGQPMLCKLSTHPSATHYTPPANRPLPPLPPVNYAGVYSATQPTRSDNHPAVHSNNVPSRPVVFKVRI